MSTSPSPTPASGPSPKPPTPPRVPDHELLRRIGKGAYGEVWLARSVTGAFRAVKIVHRASFDHDRPFEREFEGIRKFEPISRTHDSQVDILHVGRNGDCFFYVMELADDQATGGQINPDNYTARTLKSDLQFHGRLPFEECVRIGIALTTALEHLHENGLVHRDVKPSNIIFVNGVPKLADIGLVTGVDATRSFVGTEGFAAPEGAGTPQADLFSLGKVLYEAATGKDRQEFPELPTLLRELPDREGLMELNAVVAKACRHDPKDRYASAGAMRADLELLQSGKSLARLHRTEKRLRFVQRAGAVVTAIAALIAAGWLWQARQTQVVRELAHEKSRLADENRNRVVRLDIANGVRLLDEGDPAGALLWFTDALPLMTNNPAEESVHRIRIQQTLDQTPRVLRVFPHESGLTVTAFSPDGRLIVTATKNGNIRVWNAEDGSLKWGPKLLPAPAYFGRFTRDGKRLVLSSSADQGTFNGSLPPISLFAILDAQTGEEWKWAEGAFESAGAKLVGASFSPDDRWLATAHADGVIRGFDMESGRRAWELRGHTAEVMFLSFAADGSLLASASLDKTVRVWRMPSGEPVGLPLEHRWPVVRAQLTGHGRYLISAAVENPGDDGGIEVAAWHLPSGRRIAGPLHPRDRISLFAAPESEGTFFVQDRAPNRLRSYSLATGEASAACPEARGVLSWSFSPDGSQLALGNNDHIAQVYDVWTGAALTPSFRHGSWGVTAVEFSPDQQSLLTACDDGNARLWDLRAKPVAESARVALPASLRPGGTTWSLQALGRSAGGTPIPLQNDTEMVIDDQLRQVHRFSPNQPGSEVLGALSAPNGKIWAIPSFQKSDRNLAELALWSQDNAHARRFPLPHPVSVYALAFTPDSQYLITACEDSRIRYWRTADGIIERTVPLQVQGKAACVEVNPQSGTGILVGPASSGEAAMKSLQFVDLETGATMGRPWELSATAFEYVFSPDGKRLAVLDELGPVTIIETRTARLITSKVRHKAKLKWAQWDLAGRRLLTVGQDDEVLVWSAETGEQLLGPLRTAGSSIRRARWSPDGRFIVTNGNDYRIRVWDATTGECVTPAWQHSYFVGPFFMTKDNRVITASYANDLLAWDLKETALPQDVLGDYARLVSGRHLSVAGAMLVMNPEELARLDHSLHASHPELFRKSVKELREWQHRQVPEPATVARIRSGLFRLERMAELDPGDAWVKEQLARFRDCQVPPRDPGTPANLVDLSDFYTHSLRGLPVAELDDLPRGVQTLAGTTFDVRGMIRLQSVDAPVEALTVPLTAVQHIPVNHRCRQLHFLQFVGGAEGKEGEEVARWVIHFTDGTSQVWPVIYGEHVRDWWLNPNQPSEASRAVIAWEGHPPTVLKRGGQSVRLFKATWNNPSPDVEVRDLDFIIGQANVRPFVIAITAE